MNRDLLFGISGQSCSAAWVSCDAIVLGQSERTPINFGG